jgi:H+/Cl- antiporter ClcA
MKPTPLAYAPGVALAALGTLPFGAVLGPEAPLIALGSAVGMAVAPLAKLDERESMVLATAGSFAAIAALFGGPIPAGVLLVEASVGLGIGAAVIPMLLPGLVSAAVGYLIFTGIGDWSGIKETVLAVPGLEPYHGVHFVDLGVAIAVGLLAALVIGPVHAMARRVAALEGTRVAMPVLLLGGGAAVGVIALVADGLGANSQDVLFSGQASLPSLLAEGSAGVVVVLLVGKALGYAISLGCGFRGGPVFPAIFLGVALAMLAVIALDIPPTLAVAVGTAAGMAAATRLLFSSLIIAALLVGSSAVDAVPPAVLAAATAWIAATALESRRDGSDTAGGQSAPATA